MHDSKLMIANVPNVGEDPIETGDYVILASWAGLDEAENSWEPCKDFRYS